MTRPRPRDIYGPGFTQADYLRALHAGYETGWWDANGIPAPWPDDFVESDADWQSSAEPSHNEHQQNGDKSPS